MDKDNKENRAVVQSVPKGNGQAHEGSEGWKVILREPDNQQVVLYNSRLRRVVVENQAGQLPLISNRERLLSRPRSFCTQCGQRIEYDDHLHAGDSNQARSHYEQDDGYMDRHYFEVLEGVKAHEDLGPVGASSAHPEALENKSLNDGYYVRFFREERKIGTGGRGHVYKCHHVMDGIELGTYAVKKIPVGDNHAWLVRTLTEVHMLEKLHHPNIVDYKHAWLEKAQLNIMGPPVPCLYILQEYADSGNLAQYLWLPAGNDSAASDEDNLSEAERRRLKKRQEILRKTRQSEAGAEGSQWETSPDAPAMGKARVLDEDEVWNLFLDLLMGLNHLHHHDIIHRDLKPQNMLLHRDQPGTVPRLLISDFGECIVADHAPYRRTGATGTIEYVAPELLAVTEMGEYEHDADVKSDMWSVGVLLYVIAYGRLPWRTPAANIADLRREIRAFDYVTFPRDVPIERSKELQSAIASLMRREPSERPDTLLMLEATRRYMKVRAKMQKHARRSATEEVSTSVSTAVTKKSPGTRIHKVKSNFDLDAASRAIAGVHRRESNELVPTSPEHGALVPMKPTPFNEQEVSGTRSRYTSASDGPFEDENVVPSHSQPLALPAPEHENVAAKDKESTGEHPNPPNISVTVREMTDYPLFAMKGIHLASKIALVLPAVPSQTGDPTSVLNLIIDQPSLVPFLMSETWNLSQSTSNSPTNALFNHLSTLLFDNANVILASLLTSQTLPSTETWLCFLYYALTTTGAALAYTIWRLYSSRCSGTDERNGGDQDDDEPRKRRKID
eukprot:Clim_evm7s219 gene=Clim_evmTU7s219